MHLTFCLIFLISYLIFLHLIGSLSALLFPFSPLFHLLIYTMWTTAYSMWGWFTWNSLNQLEKGTEEEKKKSSVMGMIHHARKNVLCPCPISMYNLFQWLMVNIWQFYEIPLKEERTDGRQSQQ